MCAPFLSLTSQPPVKLVFPRNASTSVKSQLVSRARSYPDQSPPLLHQSSTHEHFSTAPELSSASHISSTSFSHPRPQALSKPPSTSVAMSATNVEKAADASVNDVATAVGNTSLNDKAAANEAASASAAEGRRLYIGNLAYATTEGELKDFFKSYLV